MSRKRKPQSQDRPGYVDTDNPPSDKGSAAYQAGRVAAIMGSLCTFTAHRDPRQADWLAGYKEERDMQQIREQIKGAVK